MANETTLSLVRQFLPDIWEAALDYIRYSFVMPGLITAFSDTTSWVDRKVTEFQEGTVDEDLGELEDLTPQQLTRRLLAVLTPAEHGMQYVITDRNLESDNIAVLARAASNIGYSLGKHLEVDLLEDLASLTGGSVGSAGAALTWANIYEGRARLAANGVPGPYSVVLHEYQWFDLATAANLVSLSSPAPLQVRNDIQSRYYLGSQGDMNFFVSGLVPIDGSDDATGGMFNREALAVDFRRGLRIEPERDASLRHTELNATMVYAHGIWRPTWGVKIISDATALGSAVTVNSDLVIAGTADDLAISAGQNVNYTFTVSNVGDVVAYGITATLTLEAPFVVVTSEVNQGSFASNVWTIGSLAPGQSVTLQANVETDTAAASTYSVTLATTTVTPADLTAATATVDVVVS